MLAIMRGSRMYLMMLFLTNLVQGLYAKDYKYPSRENHYNQEIKVREDVQVGEEVGLALYNENDLFDQAQVGDELRYPVPYYFYFDIHPNAVLVVKRKLDREYQDTYIIWAWPLNPAVPMTITKVKIIDVNDNEPKWKESKDLSIPEDSDVGASFYAGYALDADSAEFKYDVQRYEIKSGFGSEFEGKTVKGKNRLECHIKIIKKLSRRKRDKYEMTLRALDGGRPPLYSDTRIVVTIGPAVATKLRADDLDESSAPSQLLNSTQLAQLIIASLLLKYFVI